MSGKLKEFDIANYLDDNKVIATYLTEILKDGDMEEFLSAIDEIARAKGMTKVSKESGLSRESLYKSFKSNAHPRFDTVLKVLNSFGIELQAVA